VIADVVDKVDVEVVAEVVVEVIADVVDKVDVEVVAEVVVEVDAEQEVKISDVTIRKVSAIQTIPLFIWASFLFEN